MILSKLVRVKSVEDKNEVGIEVEVEGDNLPEAPVGWRRIEDGSLRGESAEYIFKRPVNRRLATTYLTRLSNAYIENGTQVLDSARQSVHVHLNVQEMEMNKVFNLITLFLIFEESLVKWCGEYREGNLFCLRSSDAEDLIASLEMASESVLQFPILQRDSNRYAAINVSSMFLHGSLEFRSMRGTDDFDLIKKWMNVLLKLKDFANKILDPSILVSMISAENPHELVAKIFKEDADIITADDEWIEHMYTGLRRIQVMAYLGNWEEYAVELQDDIIGRRNIYEDFNPDVDGRIYDEEENVWVLPEEFIEHYGLEDEYYVTSVNNYINRNMRGM